MATISDDLRVEILLRLPTKSLLRFKSVCKRWRSLISSRRFCLLHTLRHPTATATATALLLRRSNLEYYHHSLFQKTPPTPLTLPGFVVQSCNGLLLCQYPGNAPSDYFIYSLATGLHRNLDVIHNDIESLTLAFDPSISAYYKLVCVKAADFPDSPFCYQIVVFDSESSSWRVVVDRFTTPMNEHFSSVDWTKGVYWNNAVHWNRIAGGLLYFDIDKGTIGQAPEFSSFYRIGGFLHLLLESGGHLHYILSGGPGGSRFIVFEMEKDYSKWSVKYEVDYGGLSSTSTLVFVVDIVRTPNEEESFVLFYVSDKLMVHNRIDDSFQELKEIPPCLGPLHQFVDSLAPV